MNLSPPRHREAVPLHSLEEPRLVRGEPLLRRLADLVLQMAGLVIAAELA